MQTCIKIELPYCPVYDCGYDAGKLHSDVINPLRCENVYTPVHNILISMQAQRCLIGQYARSELNLDLSIYGNPTASEMATIGLSFRSTPSVGV